MKKLKQKLIVFALVFSITLLSVVATALFRGHVKSGAIVIGAKNCTEQHILGEMLAIMLEEHLGLSVQRMFHLDNTSVCFSALKSGEIDLYSEYTGTALLQILGEKELSDRDSAFARAKTLLDRRFALTLLPPFGFENSYVLIMHGDVAREKGIYSLDDLKDHLSDLKVAYDPEFYSRPERKMLEKSYPKLAGVKPMLMDHTLLYTSLVRNDLDLIDGYSTDGFITGSDLLVLKDSNCSLPGYDCAVIVREEILETYPEVQKIICMLKGQISTEEMKQLNYYVEKKGDDVYTVAKQYLSHKKLLHAYNRHAQSVGVGATPPPPSSHCGDLSHDQNSGHSVPPSSLCAQTGVHTSR